MKAIVIDTQGSEAGWELVERPTPAPGPGQVLVRVHAASLNYRDLLVLRAGGVYGAPAHGIVALSDGAGEVVAIGQGVRRWTRGDRVMTAYYPTWHGGAIRPEHDHASPGAFSNDGVLAEYAIFDEAGIVRAPSYLSYEAASTLPCAALTAWNALFETGTAYRPGGTLLVQGTGGVSLFAAQFALAAGLRVIATSSSEAKLERLRATLGIADLVDYRARPEWHEVALEATGGAGVDQVIDVGGAQTLTESFKATTFGGTVSVVGMLGGVVEKLDPLPILFRALRVDGVRVGSTRMLESMTEALERIRIHPIVDEVFPLEQATLAMAKLQAGTHFGKIVIRLVGDA